MLSMCLVMSILLNPSQAYLLIQHQFLSLPMSVPTSVTSLDYSFFLLQSSVSYYNQPTSTPIPN